MSEERRFDVRTLIIASIASAAAAIVTSQFWVKGTPIAAALTPVIVTIFSELLHRPTEKIAERFTSETDALPEAAGAEPPPPDEEAAPRPAVDDSMTIYKTSKTPNRLHWRVIALTAAAAFVIGAGALTLTEVLAGGSIGDTGRKSTIFRGAKKKQQDTPPQTVTQPVQTVTTPAEQPPQTTPETTPTQPAETEPQATQTTPAPRQTPPPATTP
jgi:hypothetical protein